MFKRLGMFDRSLGMFQPAGSIPYPGPQSLFANGEQGAWYDPSDLSSMFQDAAGTTPAQLEQPVGLLLDKSGRGNHASQTTLAARPVLSARYNLLTYTEQFDNAAWTKLNISAANTTVTTDPLGGTTADVITVTGGSTVHNITAATFTISSGSVYTLKVYAKAGTHNYFRHGQVTGSAWPAPGTWWWDLSNGTFNGSLGSGWSNQSITSVGNGWYLCQVTVTASATDSEGYGISLTDSSGNIIFSASGATMYIWGADLRVANDGVVLPSYQRVAAATGYDSTGFPTYLRFDGIDDCLFTSAIDFTATDKMTVWAGLRKLNDSATAILYELSADTTVNNGVFRLTTPSFSGTFPYAFVNKGSVQANASTADTSKYGAPVTNCVTCIGDITNDVSILRLNAVQIDSATADLGAGNYGNYPLYVGRRNNATLQFSGRLYALIIRGAQSTETQITQTETWVNGKTKAY